MRNYMVRMRSFLLLSIILISIGLTKGTESNIQNNDNSVIFFLILRISKDPVQGKSVIEFVSKTKSFGKIKNNFYTRIDSENYLTIKVYERDKLINTIVMTHPLYKNVEYLDSNNALTTKYIELNEKEFFIRLQVNDNNSNKIIILETLKNSDQKELTTIKL